MPDSLNTGGNKPQELSMEMRLLLAIVLMGVVMFFTQNYFTSSAPKKNPAPTAQTSSGSAEPAPPAAPAAGSPAKPPAAAAVTTPPTGPVTPVKVEGPLVIQTDLYRVTFSNQGANVRTWELRQYHGNDGKPLALVNTAAGMDFPFSMYFKEGKPPVDINWSWFKQTVDPDKLGVTYEFSDGHTTARKVFRFQQHSYLVMVSSECAVDGKPLPHLLEWRGGFGDLTVASAAANQRTLYFDVTQNKLVEQTAKAAANGPVTATGNFSFGGIADNYFAAVFLSEGGWMQQITFADRVKTPINETPALLTGVAVSDGAANRFEVFVGPKDLDLLAKINPKLVQMVDFGWLAPLSKVLFLAVRAFNNNVVHNFGWSIVLVTIILNFILFPIKLSSMKQMKKMQALKPQIDAINNKYKNVGLRDPRKGDQNQEVMDLYKKHGVNPMGGCVPMVLQIPFFIAFYKVFTVSVEMRGAAWLWVPDLSQPEPWQLKALPLIMIASQFIMQKMTPQPAGDPAQQKMMMLMPLMFGFMFYNFPSGLVLYYLTSNLVSMGQQWFFNKTSLATVAAQSVLPPKKNGRK
jgi:YidC/Oxa1 family membrane protein insertase